MAQLNRSFPRQPFAETNQAGSADVPQPTNALIQPAALAATATIEDTTNLSIETDQILSPAAFAAGVSFPALTTGFPTSPYGPFDWTGTEQDTADFGGTATDESLYLTLGGSFTDGSLNTTTGGSFTDANLLSATIGDTLMQALNITLAEFNDETINIAILNNSSAFNLTGYNVNVLLKTAAGVQDSDPTTVKFSSAGVDPAVTITSASGGLATLVIPNESLDVTTYGFWRVDVELISTGQQSTAIYGTVTVKPL